MDKISKFLKSLNKKQRKLISEIFQNIILLNINKYDVKQLKEYKNIFRLRKNNLRIIFSKKENKGFVLDIAYRKDIYKKK